MNSTHGASFQALRQFVGRFLKVKRDTCWSSAALGGDPALCGPTQRFNPAQRSIRSRNERNAGLDEELEAAALGSSPRLFLYVTKNATDP